MSSLGLNQTDHDVRSAFAKEPTIAKTSSKNTGRPHPANHLESF